MGLWSRLFGQREALPAPAPRAHVGGGVTISTPQELEAYIKANELSFGAGGMSPSRAMQLTAVQACVRLISGGVANTPRKVIRDDDGEKNEAKGSELWTLIKRRPNSWMRPGQFLRLGTAHVLLRGNFFAYKVRAGNGHVTEMRPIHPDRCRAEEAPDGEIVFKYNRKSDGVELTLTRKEILHVYLHTFDGIMGTTPIQYAHGSLTSALAAESYSSSVFKNGARVAGILTTDKRLGKEGRQNIREALEEYRAGEEREGREIILEEGMRYERLSLSPADAQTIESRKLNKADIFECYGIPLHMTSLADKQSNWGTGVEEHNKQFIQWVLEDYFTMWEEAINLDVADPAGNLSTAFDRAELTRGDLEARTKHQTAMLQWGVKSPDEIRQEMDLNPRKDGAGGQYYPPPNMTDTTDTSETEDEPDRNEPAGG